MNNNPTSTTHPIVERAFCVVDLENLAQGSANVGHLSRYLQRVVDSVTSTFQTHITVVATGPRAIDQSPEILWDWNGCRFLTGHGLDGADNELISVLTDEPAAAASSHILVWSGDGIFSESLLRLRCHGCRISVLGPCGSISDRLYSVAHDVTELPLYLLDPDFGLVEDSVTNDQTVAA